MPISMMGRFVIMAFLAAMLGSCGNFMMHRKGESDRIVEQLSIGMSKEQVVARLGSPVHKGELLNLMDILHAGREAYPTDLLQVLTPTTETWLYSFWITSNDARGVRIFFSKDGHVTGWYKDHSDWSRDKYLHEQLTSELKLDMKNAKVQSLIGAPQNTIHRQLSNNDLVKTFRDHYWTKDPTQWNAAYEIWIYRYPIGNGQQRTVYVVWNTVGVDGWGYDHAHLEAERYLLEHKQ